MKNEIIKTEQEAQKKSTYLFVIFTVWQIVLAILLIAYTTFSIFVGMSFLAFMNHEKSYRVSVTNKHEIRREVKLEQLQQMNTIIKQGFDLILDQRQENQALQTRVQELTVAISKNTEERDESSPNMQREKH